MSEVCVDFATAADLEPMADLLGELFTLERDFQPGREKQLAGLRLRYFDCALTDRQQ